MKNIENECVPHSKPNLCGFICYAAATAIQISMAAMCWGSWEFIT
jgi:hypothetical protein